jgi:hypothetical protein
VSSAGFGLVFFPYLPRRVGPMNRAASGLCSWISSVASPVTPSSIAGSASVPMMSPMPNRITPAGASSHLQAVRTATSRDLRRRSFGRSRRYPVSTGSRAEAGGQQQPRGHGNLGAPDASVAIAPLYWGYQAR